MSVLSIKEMYAIAARQLLAGNAPKAREIYRRIVKHLPDEPYALHLLGRSESACGCHGEAILTLHRSLAACAPGDDHLASATWNQIGESQRAQALHEEAIAAYERALEHDPRSADALCNMGIALRRSGRLEEARQRLEEAIALRPEKAIAHNNLGNVLRTMGRNVEAAEAYRKALLHNPNLFEGHNNLANTLRDLGNPVEAMRAYERALALRPDSLEVLINLRHAAAQVFDVARADWAARRLARFTSEQLDRGESATESVLSCSLRGADDTTIRQVARSRAPIRASAGPAGRARADAGKIRLGYLIDGAANRPAWRRLAFLVDHHDRDRFDLRLYRTGVPAIPPGSPDIAEVVDLHDLNDRAAADRIAGDSLDVLVDLVGQEPDGRLGILAHRPAGLQLIWSHLELTTGMEAADYLVTDPIAVPPALARCFTERLLYLPPLQRALGASAMDRDPGPNGGGMTTGIGRVGITFAALGRPLRFSSEIVTAWMRILGEVEESVIVVNRMNPHALANLRAFAHKQGIDGMRLIVAPRQATRLAQLRQLADVDIALDTAPQSSAAAVLDALSLGLPVVSLCGTLPAERTGCSLLTAFEREDCIAGSVDDYVARAVSLARASETRHDRSRARNSLASNRCADVVRILEAEIEALAGGIKIDGERSPEMATHAYPDRDSPILHAALSQGR